MIRIKNCLFTLGFIALGLVTIASMSTAQAQYQVTGTTAGGGNVVVGDGVSLGSLSSGDGTLTPFGGDLLTFNPGSIAIGSGADTISFTSLNNTVYNYGTVSADYGYNAFEYSMGQQSFKNFGMVLGGAGAPDTGSGGYGGGIAIDFYSPIALNSITIDNFFKIAGGDGSNGTNGSAGSGGTAINIYANTGDINGTIVNNNGGLILGGNGGLTTLVNSYGGYGGDGISVHSDSGVINGFLLINTGTVQGGKSGDSTYYSYDGGAGVNLYSYYATTGVRIDNYSLIGGGNSGMVSGTAAYYTSDGGDALYIYSSNDGLSDLMIRNFGTMQGGTSGNVSGGIVQDMYSGYGGNGAYLYGSYNIDGVTFLNSGQVLGGNSGDVTGNYAYESYAGGNGLYVYASSFEINNLFIGNSGLMQGGNSGIVSGSYAYYSYEGGAGIYVDASNDALNSTTVQNSGTVRGGNSGNVIGSGTYLYSGNGGDAAYFYGEYGINQFNLNNSGLMVGGNGGDLTGNYAYYTYHGGDALSLDTYYNGLDGITIANSGTMRGGNSGNITGGIDYDTYSERGGHGMNLYSYYGDITNTNIGNSGLVIGGNSGNLDGPYAYYSEDGGSAVYVYSEDSNVDAFTLTNSGTLQGGKSGNLINGTEYYEYAGYGGNGVYIYASEGMEGISIANSGLMAGGNSGNVTGTTAYETYNGGYALYIESGDDDIIGLSIANSGQLIGGNTGDITGDYAYYAYEGGYGMYVYSDEDLTDTTIINSGLSLGGNGGNVSGGIYYDEYGGGGGYGAYIGAGDDLENFSLTNSGTFAGGKGGNVGGANSYAGGDGGYGIYIDVDDDTDGFTLNNLPGGLIKGGNGGNAESNGSPGQGGTGLYLNLNNASGAVVNNWGSIVGGKAGTAPNDFNSGGDGLYADANNLTINNWGDISDGGGKASAIYINGANNTLNLNGHSTVHGKITADDDNNVINLNFTGLSLAQQAILTAEIVSQGNLDHFTGHFTVRGLVYVIDPMVIHLNLSSYQQQGLTPNQAAIGAALDSAIVNPTGETLALMNAIDASGNVPLALDQLSPQKYEFFGDIALSNATFLGLQISQRLNNLRDGSESIDTIGYDGGSTVLGFTKDDKGKDVIQSTIPTKRWGFFASAQGTFLREGGRDGLQDTRSNTAGVLLGIDGKIGENGVIGLLAAYDSTDADLDQQGSTADINSYTGGVYGSYHRDGFYTHALGAYTRNDYKSQRAIIFPGFNRVASGDTDGNQYTFNLDGGYDFKVNDKFTLGPIGGLQYVRVDVNSFTETGAGGANLAIGNQNVDSLRSRLGLRMDYHYKIDNELAVAFEARAAWQHEFLDDSRSINAGFVGSGLSGFSVNTTSPRRDTVLAGVGVNFTLRDRITLFGDYDVQMGNGVSDLQHSIKGGFKIAW